TEKVIRTSDIPVLAIKGNNSEISFNKVVFANDFTEESAKGFEKIINFLKLNGANPHFLMINTPNNFKPTHVAEQMAHDFLKQFNLDAYEFSIYNDLDIEKGILNFADRINADLIAMGTHGRKGFARLLNGSISEDLLNHSPKSIITFMLYHKKNRLSAIFYFIFCNQLRIETSSLMMFRNSEIATRSCFMVSRWRMVTVLSSNV